MTTQASPYALYRRRAATSGGSALPYCPRLPWGHGRLINIRVLSRGLAGMDFFDAFNARALASDVDLPQ